MTWVAPGEGDGKPEPERSSNGVWVVLAIIGLIVVLTMVGGGPTCVDGADLFAPDEAGSAFLYYDDDGDGEFDRTRFKGTSGDVEC